MQLYLDNAASTSPSRKVMAKLNSVIGEYGNPSSVHEIGERAKNIVTESKEIIAKRINGDPNHIYFTSGATMSNSVAIQGFFRKHPDGAFITSAIEHNDIMMIESYMCNHGIETYVVPVKENGIIDLQRLCDILCDLEGRHTLVSIQAANGECGVVQNLRSISSLVHNYDNAYFHTDATQYIAHYPIDVESMGIDMMSMSGQKIHCIKGIGLLYNKEETHTAPLIFGEQGLIGGTENVLGIACLGEAFKSITYNDCTKMRDSIISELERIGGILIGDWNLRLDNNAYMLFRGIDAESMVQMLSDVGVYVSAGSACSSIGMKPSHVVMAMGYSEQDAKSCIRITLSGYETEDDLKYAVNAIKHVVGILR